MLGISFALIFQMSIVAAAQALPVLAPFAASTFGVEPKYVGYFTAIVFISALFSSNGTAGLLARWGSLNGSAAALVIAGLGVGVAAVSNTAWGLIAAAILLGVGYGPVNPAGSRLLVRVSAGYPQNLVFSIKQTSVAIGGAAAGAMLPVLAVLFGWRAALVTMGVLCILVALASIPVRRRLGDDANALASMRFKGPIGPARALWADPLLRALSIGMFSFSMAQFGLMSIYVTLLWSRLDMTPEVAAAMLSLALAASVFGRLYWGWRADSRDPMKILSGLAACGAVSLAAVLAMSPDWPLAASILVSGALGLGPLSWSGVFLSEIAQAGEVRGGSEGIVSVTAGMMVFGYLGGVVGPGLLSLSAALFGGYGIGISVVAMALATTSVILARNARPKSAKE